MANVMITIPYDETQILTDAINSVNRDTKDLTILCVERIGKIDEIPADRIEISYINPVNLILLGMRYHRFVNMTYGKDKFDLHHYAAVKHIHH